MAKLAIVGLGYLGTALGLASRASQLFEMVAGYDARPENAQAALAHGAVQAVARGAREAVAGATVTLLAVPDDALAGVLRDLRHAFDPGAVVSSTGLWMAPAMAAAEVLPANVHFLAGRPVIDHFGLPAAEASAQALRGAIYCLDTAPQVEAAALDTLSALARGLGAQPYFTTAQEHDGLLSASELLPRLVLEGLLHGLASAPTWREVGRLSGRGLAELEAVNDELRALGRRNIAGNSESLRAALEDAAKELQKLSRALAEGEPALEAYQQQCTTALEAWQSTRRQLMDGTLPPNSELRPRLLGSLSPFARRPRRQERPRR